MLLRFFCQKNRTRGGVCLVAWYYSVCAQVKVLITEVLTYGCGNPQCRSSADFRSHHGKSGRWRLDTRTHSDPGRCHEQPGRCRVIRGAEGAPIGTCRENLGTATRNVEKAAFSNVCPKRSGEQSWTPVENRRCWATGVRFLWPHSHLCTWDRRRSRNKRRTSSQCEESRSDHWLTGGARHRLTPSTTANKPTVWRWSRRRLWCLRRQQLKGFQACAFCRAAAFSTPETKKFPSPSSWRWRANCSQHRAALCALSCQFRTRSCRRWQIGVVIWSWPWFFQRSGRTSRVACSTTSGHIDVALFNTVRDDNLRVGLGHRYCN